MNKDKINEILKQHEKVIKDAIKKVNINKYSLSTRCVNLDDIYQEVCIHLWKELTTIYDSSKMNVTDFISYQASWYAKRLYTNVLKSPRCFTGSKIKKSPKSGSQQALIDSNKSLLSEITEPNNDEIDHNSAYCNPLKEFIFQNCQYSNNFDMEYDYDYLIKEIKNKLHNKYSKELYKYDEEMYQNIFNDLLETDISFNSDEERIFYVDGKFYKKLAEKYGFKCVDNMRYILNQIKDIVLEVIEDYNK